MEVHVHCLVTVSAKLDGEDFAVKIGNYIYSAVSKLLMRSYDCLLHVR